MNRSAHCHLESVTLDIPGKGKREARASLGRFRRAGSDTARTRRGSSRTTPVRVLDDVTLRLEAGCRVGVIGPNGAGKTSLLRVLAGIYQPSAGFYSRQGRVSTLRPLKPTKPDKTGYDSLIVQGTLLGLDFQEIRKRFEEVAAFCELGERLALPATTYSSGMLARLTFAAFACYEPEILLIDEWINTVDREFLDKVEFGIRKLSGNGGIFVLASHQYDLLARMCTTGVMLEGGRVRQVGPIDDVLRRA